MSSTFPLSSPGIQVAVGFMGISLVVLLIGVAVGVLGGYVGLIVGITVLFGAIVLWNYRLGILLAVLMLPFSATDIFPRQMFGIIGLNPLNALLALTIFSFLLAWLFQRRENEIPIFLPLFWLLVLPIFLATLHGTLYIHLIPFSLSAAEFETVGGYWMGEFLKPMIIVVVALLVAVLARNSRRPTMLLVPLFLSAAILELVVVTYVALSGASLHALASSFSRGFLSWTGMHANNLGLLFNMAFTLAFFTLLASRRNLGWLLLVGTVGLSMVATALTFSRGAYVGFFVTLAYFLVTRRKIRSLLMGLLLVAIIFLSVPQAVVDRIMTGVSAGDMDQISAGRVSTIWKPLAPTILEAPLFGHGLNSVLWATPVLSGAMPPVGHPHNAYLRLLLDYGVVGATVIALFYRRLWRLFRQLKENLTDSIWTGFFEGASVCLWVLAAQGLTDDSFTPTFSQSYMWLAAGIAIGLARRIRSADEPPTQRFPEAPLPKIPVKGDRPPDAPTIFERS